ncbi:MAG: valine--tRNA ligase [Chloroflexota bacterium]
MSESSDKTGELNLSTTYDPKAVEERIYRFWEDNGYFAANVNPAKKPYCIVMPPPNITGNLHIGHALDLSMQDTLTRWHRMMGDEALWLPGMDHASIATEAKVVETLAKEGIDKWQLGREGFLARSHEWADKYRDIIRRQAKGMGLAPDWRRERFTLDEGLSRAVHAAFIRLYERGLIYRGTRITNWCPHCQTVISDIEVEHEERQGNLWHIRYPFADGNGEVVVATTRPETMLGDTAVAVNPADPRYQGLVGKTVILPVMDREIPIIADEYVDREFGTGAVKVTPSHDPNDFEMGLRHKLARITVIGKDGRMTAEAGKYAGMDRYECRKALVRDLEAQGYLLRIEPHTHAVGQCSRCDSVIEPLISEQWFVKMKPLAEPAIAAVKDGSVRFVPERFTRVYLHWMENIQDWCISRQLWWGHRIPAWYCDDCGEIIVAADGPKACPKCGSSRLRQDEDVLDTWFSSALWPFSTLGWPDRTPELDYFYPTSVLVTGYDIIFFWVARMIFSGLEYMGEKPFHDVLIHGLVRDDQGRKMSKSLGNGIDPLDVIRDYGADTLRFSVMTGMTPGNDTRFFQEKIDGARNFINKLWNASRFALMNLVDFQPTEAEFAAPAYDDPRLTLADRWILSRFAATAAEVQQLLTDYQLGEAARALYDFTWSEFCDWYIEMAKPRLYNRDDQDGRRATQRVLRYVLDQTLRLLHPLIPFATEEIWQALPHQGQSIMVAPWPGTMAQSRDAASEREAATLMDIVKSVRNIRAELGIAPGKKAQVIIHADQAGLERVRAGEQYLKTLAGVSEVVYQTGGEKPRQAMVAVVAAIEVYVPLRGLIDLDKELARLTKEAGEAEAETRRLTAKLANPGFRGKAPAEVVAKEEEKLRLATERHERLKARIEALRD